MLTLEVLIQVSAWFFLVYFLFVNGSYIFIQLLSLVGIQKTLNDRPVRPAFDPHESPFVPGIAILLPAYNEAPVIVSSIRSLLSVEYPDFEIIAINDGSTDDTLNRMQEAFDLQKIDADYPLDLPCEQIHDIYRASDVDLVVIDKENGGKSDALNAGLFFTDQPLFCAVDADTIIEREALLKAAQPFLRDPDQMVATGGTVRVANGCDIQDSIVQNVKLSNSWLVNLQVMEYIRAFLTGRIGLSEINSLIVISGAFGLFRTGSVRDIGGYSTDTITEDLELVIRLHRYLKDHNQPYGIEFVPHAAVWTQVPETLSALGNQRSRWFRGLLESISMHRDMIGRPEYGTIGLIGFPFSVLVEALGPIIEGLGYVFVPVAFVFGFLNISFFLLFLGVAVGLGIFMSWLSVFCEIYGFRQYDRLSDILRVMFYGVMENILYRQWKALVSFGALIDYLKGDSSWGEMTRLGLEQPEE